MDRRKGFRLLLILCAALACGAFLTAEQANKPVTVTLCDGKTQAVVPGKMDRQEAQLTASVFLAQWRKNNPGVAWEMAQAVPPKPASRPTQVEVYNRVSKREEFIWKAELEKFVREGDRIFHDAEAFGGTVGISCDMCHPHASNTHPETYPKYQVQLQRVALLRDMINWCIQHPTKGKPLADDDPRLRAMEAYIISQRTGKAIEPGKR